MSANYYITLGLLVLLSVVVVALVCVMSRDDDARHRRIKRDFRRVRKLNRNGGWS